MCDQCEKTREIIASARLACQLSGRMDIDRVLFDIEEQIMMARVDAIRPVEKD
jgi:hypothetical protein